MKLLVKFNLSCLLVFLLGLAGAIMVADYLLKAATEQDVADKGRMLLAKVQAVKTYTATEIRPLLARQAAGKFFPQSVPFYSVAEVVKTLEQSNPDYTFKAAMFNPTNPHDRAEPWEAKVIDKFAADPSLTEFAGEVRTASGKSLYVIAHPVRLGAADAGCLACHSTPAAAPKAMVEAYGSVGGFGWKLDQLLGAEIVKVPMDVPTAVSRRALMVVGAALTGVFVLVGLMLNYMLSRLVIQPVCKMAELADQVSQGDLEAPEFKRKSRDEIGMLAESFGRMRKSLVHALRLLDE